MSKLKPQYLVDVNVWFALVYQRHVHHDIAVTWFDSVNDGSAACCRVIQLGLFRLLTNTAVMGDDVQTQSGAWLVWERLIQDVRVVFASESGELETFLRRFSGSKQSGHRPWTDAYLAAFAESGGLQIVTFDQGFKAYKGLVFTRLHAN